MFSKWSTNVTHYYHYVFQEHGLKMFCLPLAIPIVHVSQQLVYLESYCSVLGTVFTVRHELKVT